MHSNLITLQNYFPKALVGFADALQHLPKPSFLLFIRGKSITSAPPRPRLSQILDLFMAEQTLKKDVPGGFYLRALITPGQLWVLSVRPPPFSGMSWLPSTWHPLEGCPTH